MTRNALYAGSRRSVKYSLTSSGARFSLLSTRGSARWRTAWPAATVVVSAQAASARPSRLALARPMGATEPAFRLAGSGLGLVVGDDVAGVQPEQVVGRAGAAGGGHRPGPTVIAGRPDHLVSAGREHRARAVDGRIVEWSRHDRPLPLSACRVVVNELHRVELSEVMYGDDAEYQPVPGDRVETALQPDRVEQLAFVSPGGLPDALVHPGGEEIGRRSGASLSGSDRDEHGRIVRARQTARHGAVLGGRGVDVETLGFRPLTIGLLVGDPDIRVARTPAHEVERLAVRRDPWLLVDGVAVDRVGQPLGRCPVRARAGPLAALADPVRDEDVRRRAEDPLVTAAREPGEIDGVPVRRDGRLVAAELVVRRGRHLLGDQRFLGGSHSVRQRQRRHNRRSDDRPRGPKELSARQPVHGVLPPLGSLVQCAVMTGPCYTPPADHPRDPWKAPSGVYSAHH